MRLNFRAEDKAFKWLPRTTPLRRCSQSMLRTQVWGLQQRTSPCSSLGLGNYIARHRWTAKASGWAWPSCSTSRVRVMARSTSFRTESTKELAWLSRCKWDKKIQTDYSMIPMSQEKMELYQTALVWEATSSPACLTPLRQSRRWGLPRPARRVNALLR